MKARDIMTAPATTARPGDTVAHVAGLMQSRNIGAVPIVDDSGALVGMITEGDFTGLARCIPFTLELAPVIFGARAASPAELESIYAKARTLRAEQVMSTNVRSIGADEPAGEVIRMMLNEDLKHVPVVDRPGGRTLVGIIARHDVLRLALKNA
jgi:CBS domain-containing protein